MRLELLVGRRISLDTGLAAPKSRTVDVWCWLRSHPAAIQQKGHQNLPSAVMFPFIEIRLHVFHLQTHSNATPVQELVASKLCMSVC